MTLSCDDVGEGDEDDDEAIQPPHPLLAGVEPVLVLGALDLPALLLDGRGWVHQVLGASLILGITFRHPFSAPLLVTLSTHPFPFLDLLCEKL